MKPFADRLIGAIRRRRSIVVAGLDPRLAYLPAKFTRAAFRRHGRTPRAAARAILEFNRACLDILVPHVAAVKPQVAFYEQWGPEGLAAFEATCRAARDRGLLVIADVKRGDVPATAEAYAAGLLAAEVEGIRRGDPPVDAVTVNPYFGTDGIAPFVAAAKAEGKGIFVLVRTSNPSAAEIQDLEVRTNGRASARESAIRNPQSAIERRAQPLYECVARLCRGWGKELMGRGGYSSLGAVVGATAPAQARAVRKLMPESFFLVPGYGAQGGTAEDIRACLNPDGLGAVVNASRSLTFPWAKAGPAPARWERSVEDAAVRMKRELEAIRLAPKVSKR